MPAIRSPRHSTHEPSDMKRTESAPHDGTVIAGALQLEFVDQCIRDNLRALAESGNIHLLYEKLNTPQAFQVLNDILNTRKPIPHPLRVLLATYFDIECPLANKI